MDKVVKCVLLDVDNVLITEVVEILADVGEPNCKLINPYQFFDMNDMKPWPKASNQKEILISSDRILTITEPNSEVTKKYLELTAE